nr:MAG TPA: hypothetical protein [Caudoviricetes sp.]
MRGCLASCGYRYCAGCNCPRSVQTIARYIAIDGWRTILCGCVFVRCKCLNAEGLSTLAYTAVQSFASAPC